MTMDYITLKTVQAFMADWEKKFPRKTTPAFLRANPETFTRLLVLVEAKTVAENSPFDSFRGMLCIQSPDMIIGIVETLNLDKEVINVTDIGVRDDA